jgi:DNA modification methylase
MVEPFAVPGGTFCDPFAGSGRLVDAARAAGMSAMGIEKNAEVQAA